MSGFALQIGRTGHGGVYDALSANLSKSGIRGQDGTSYDRLPLWGKSERYDPFGPYPVFVRKLDRNGQTMEYQGKHRKMRFSTKMGLIRLMHAKRMMTTNQAIRAIFA